MSARRTVIHLVTKATIGFAALFLVSVLLAAMPGHHAPTVGSSANASTTQNVDAPQQGQNSNIAGMKPPSIKKPKKSATIEGANAKAQGAQK
jgi:hypothetical protein